MTETILTKRETCYGCAVRCKRVVELDSPWKVDPEYGGPEYETVGSFGSSLGNSDLASVAKANELCAAYGIDTISTGMTIAHAMELWQREYIDESDTGGLDLTWGNAQTVVKLVDMIANREGFGDELAEGSYRYTQTVEGETEQYLMHVKGQEIPMHEPRIKQALGVGYSLSPTGADHMHNIHDTAYTKEGSSLEKLRLFGDFDPMPATELSDEKMELFFHHANWRHFLDCVGMCHFVPYDAEQLRDLVNACTGWDTDIWELLRVGELGSTMARAVNIKFGLGAETDTLPERFFRKFNKTKKGEPLDREEWRAAKRQYCEQMGWDPETGVPQLERLEELGVGWISEAMKQ
jgi:aldehyde:ferredoxin oxidoreductase